MGSLIFVDCEAVGGAHNDTICVADEATADIILRQASFMEPEFPSKA